MNKFRKFRRHLLQWEYPAYYEIIYNAPYGLWMSQRREAFQKELRKTSQRRSFSKWYMHDIINERQVSVQV